MSFRRRGATCESPISEATIGSFQVGGPVTFFIHANERSHGLWLEVMGYPWGIGVQVCCVLCLEILVQAYPGSWGGRLCSQRGWFARPILRVQLRATQIHNPWKRFNRPMCGHQRSHTGHFTPLGLYGTHSAGCGAIWSA